MSLKNIDILSEGVFAVWAVLRLYFHVLSGNVGWSAAWGAGVMLAVGVFLVNFSKT